MATESFRAPGRFLTLLAPYDRLTSGLGALVGRIFGVSTDTVLNGVAGIFDTEGVHEIAKVGSQAWTAGTTPIHWDDGNKRCTSVATAGQLIGVAAEDAGSGAGVVLGKVKLIGNAVPALEGPQAAEADTAAATAAAPAAVAAYTALTNLTNPVTKTEGEALSTQLAVARLTDENLRAQVAALVIDVAALRVTVNSLLAKLRITGQIAAS